MASEEYQKREDQLFGPGFLEKASKKLEMQKALAKISADQTSRKRQWDSTDDKSDLRRFLSRGTPARYGGRSQRHSKPYKQPYKTQQKPSIPSYPPIQYRERAPSKCNIIRSHKPSLNISTPNSRQSGSLSTQLGEDYFGPLDFGGSERVSSGLHPPSFPAISTSHNSQVTHGTAANRGRGEHSTAEAGSDQGQS